jgi:hypothetical protein
LQPQEEEGVSAVAFQTPDNAVVIILYSRWVFVRLHHLT